ncbi:MAG: DNA polymerase IV [Cyclobacteriaceae bacterium]
MDAFYASVEQRDNPELKGKPIAVGGNKERGVVAAASYEARKFGVKSAMPSVIAARQCPNLIFVTPRFEKYQLVSKVIREIFYEYTDLVEPLSLDEAYLDVTQNKKGLNSATLIAQEIRQRIFDETALTASAGISYNKFLAKTASDINKPNGYHVILPEEASDFLARLPVSKFFGIGKATAEKMKTAGIFTGKDLRKKTLDDLKLRFGKSGSYYFNICRGIDQRSVKPDRERKSISAENTFDLNLMERADIDEAIESISKTVFDRYERLNKVGKTVTVKVKYADFKQVTRSTTQGGLEINLENLISLSKSLITEDMITDVGIRLLGVGVSNFIEEEPESKEEQLTLGF